MTEPHTTATDARPTADELFTNRLYAGEIGSGKSVTVGENIREFLNAEPDARVIDIVTVPDYDRQGFREDYDTYGTVDDIGLAAPSLDEHVEESPYTRLEAEYSPAQYPDAARHCFERALAVTKESERRVITVFDDLAWGFDNGLDTIEWKDLLSTIRNDGGAVWAVDQEPFRTGFAEVWVESGGEIVLHSRPTDPAGAAAAGLSDADISHVSSIVTRETGPNPILVGTPGQWERVHVTMTE